MKVKYYFDYNYYIKLIKDLEEYIKEKSGDNSYYLLLSDKAPTQRAKTLLLEFSKDEGEHAKNLLKAYCYLTGTYYTIPPAAPPLVPEYQEALKQRLIVETSNYKKYGEQYLKAPTKYLQDLFFSLRTASAIQAKRIPLLMEEEKED